MTVEQGQQAARQAAIIMLSKIRSALGSLGGENTWSRGARHGDFEIAEQLGEQPRVINGFSDLMVEVISAMSSASTRARRWEWRGYPVIRRSRSK